MPLTESNLIVPGESLRLLHQFACYTRCVVYVGSAFVPVPHDFSFFIVFERLSFHIEKAKSKFSLF